jgi:hypothetical protein
MLMTEQFRRRVRIKGEHTTMPTGTMISIQDVETGEGITNISKAVITLIPGELNIVEFTYIEANELGQIFLHNGDVVEKHLKLNGPEIDLTALERLQKDKHGHEA